MTPQMAEAELRRQLLESVQRYGKEFRRRNPEVREEVESVCASIRAAERLDGDLMRRLQILQLLIYGCYTKQAVIVASSLQVCHLLAAQDLLLEYDRQLLAQLVTEMADSDLHLAEIGATALACALTPNRLNGVYLGKAVGVCLRQNCCIADLHRLAALVLDRVPTGQIADSVTEAPPSPSFASPTRKAPPKDAATADAFALLRDLLDLSDPGCSAPAAWLHGVVEVSPLVAFDVVAYAVHNRAAMLLDDGELEQLLCGRVFPAVAAGLHKAGAEGTKASDELFLRLCVLAHLLLRNYGAVPRVQPPCTEVLRCLLRGLPRLPPNQRCMALQAWASLLTRVRGPTVSLYFPAALADTVEWLCETLRAACDNSEEAALEAAPGAYVAFRGAQEVALKEAQLAIDLEWFCTQQRSSFSPPEARFLLLASLRALLVSLNAVLAQPEADERQDLRKLLCTTCRAATGTLAALVWRCVHRSTEQSLALSLETLFELSGRSGHEETCRAIMALYRSVANDCLSRLAEGPSPETAARLAQFAASGIRLASEYAPFVPTGPLGWAAFCEMLAGVVAQFDFPLFSASFEAAAGAPPPEIESCHSEAERGEMRQELLYEAEAFAATTSRFPLEVLRSLLGAQFEFGQAADKDDTGRLFFVMAKVTELAVFNLQRFHAFAGQWLSSFVLLFFVESPHDLPAARHCFRLLFDRLARNLELTPAGVTEEAIVAALHLLESCSERSLMALQIDCLRDLLHVLNIRTATGVGGDLKTLVALPDLLRRHSQLPHADNVRAAAAVFAAFAASPAIEAAPPALRRQACERGLRLGLELLRQEVALEVAAGGPETMRRLFRLVDAGLQQPGSHQDVEAFLLELLPELERFCRDGRPQVAAEASCLLFDLLGGSALRLSNRLFSVLASEMLLSGLQAFISSFEEKPGDAQVPEKIEAFANYILNAASCLLHRYSQEQFRPHVPVDLWCRFFLRLQDACQLAIEPITFAVLSAFSTISSGLASLDDDKNVTAIRAALWPQGTALAWEATRPRWRITTEVLLPDTVLLLCDLFALQFLALDSGQRQECVDLTVRMIRHRSPRASAQRCVVAKERALLSLLERVSRGLFERGGAAGQQLAGSLIAAVCDVFFEAVTMADDSESDAEPTWPLPHHRPYMRLAFSLMTDFTAKVVSKRGKECSEWLQQHMCLCEKASRYQYRCSDLYTWRCVHNSIAIAVDSLTTAVEVCGGREDLADSYERFLSCHLFSADKHSRFLSSADFLEHQTMERELLGSMRDFVSTPNGSVGANTDCALHTRLSRYLVTQLGSKAHEPVPDAVVNTQTAGPGAADEFFDSRHWRFQTACVETLVAIVHSLKNIPRKDGYACGQVFDAYISYAKEALSSFHERLEVRGAEPLPAVCYFEVTAIVTTMKDLLEGGDMSSIFIPGIVELYPFLVDLVTLLHGRLLTDLLAVLHAYKAFMCVGKGLSPPRMSVAESFMAALR